MSVQQDCKYAQTHEWFRLEGEIVTIGITKFAADELTDITYVELPDVGARIEAGGVLGEVESVKATSELYSAVGGEVIEVNERLGDEPELVNTDSQGDGWMVKIKTSDIGPLEKLMDAAGYEKMIAE